MNNATERQVTLSLRDASTADELLNIAGDTFISTAVLLEDVALDRFADRLEGIIKTVPREMPEQMERDALERAYSWLFNNYATISAVIRASATMTRNVADKILDERPYIAL